MNEFKGFSLFNDVEDKALQSRNRAVVMANMATNHRHGDMISPNGAGLVIGYFDNIPNEDRPDVLKQYMQFMYERGFAIEQ